MKKILNYKTVFLGITCLFVLFFYIQYLSSENTKEDETTFALQVIEQDSLWIYEVYEGNNLFIRQEYIPAVKGKQVFKSKEDAEKIGNLVMSKLSNNKMPVISIEDLNASAITFKKI
ncbi:DUF4907 domain-containing protein [Winogradskyella undariae]|uniref:DUF4907 domain-containing protein n=1 Tax=Winogradskyella undariae TaxID=1285465 RepID=UPI0015C6C246|nr:DUF4907 domain-containing protein [Winogradskyella undariae]QNK78689.1 DUF4907 domain-containing protein [Winogradskyella sp. PAMC22761]